MEKKDFWSSACLQWLQSHGARCLMSIVQCKLLTQVNGRLLVYIVAGLPHTNPCSRHSILSRYVPLLVTGVTHLVYFLLMWLFICDSGRQIAFVVRILTDGLVCWIGRLNFFFFFFPANAHVMPFTLCCVPAMLALVQKPRV